LCQINCKLNVLNSIWSFWTASSCKWAVNDPILS